MKDAENKPLKEKEAGQDDAADWLEDVKADDFKEAEDHAFDGFAVGGPPRSEKPGKGYISPEDRLADSKDPELDKILANREGTTEADDFNPRDLDDRMKNFSIHPVYWVLFGLMVGGGLMGLVTFYVSHY